MANENETKEESGWIGFDLDGTLAEYTTFKGPLEIGKPVERMCALMKSLKEQGKTVKILTARVGNRGLMLPDGVTLDDVREAINKWCDNALGFRPEITCSKDWKLESLYDDRAIQVEKNVGITASEIVTEMNDLAEEGILALTRLTLGWRTDLSRNEDVKAALKALLTIKSKKLQS